MFSIGYDIGSSSIKAAIIDLSDQTVLAVVQSPKKEMKINALKPQWAEQNPEDWWQHVCLATQQLLEEINVAPGDIKSIGISYQMHGLVPVDKKQKVVRPSIIWCDSRAVDIGEEAFNALGQEFCLSHYLNSPGNFTASKLAWVKQNEPANYDQMDKMMLPGDFLAMKMTGEINTTITGLSEGILWDFKENNLAHSLLRHFQIDEQLIPDIVDNFTDQGHLQQKAAQEMGLVAGIPITYRAGDQPNNALSLGVLQPGQVAATGGTSGVVYGVVDKPVFDLQSRVNAFAHVNHSAEKNRIGVLLCINGAGSQHRFMRALLDPSLDYNGIEKMAQKVNIGSEGLMVYPFGNGAERMLNNQNKGADIKNIDFNIHSKPHFYRAGLEGIAFSFAHGMEIMRSMGVSLNAIKAGDDNLFQSQIFSQTLANIAQTEIELIHTTGAVGAAQASAIGIGQIQDLNEAISQMATASKFAPDQNAENHKNAFYQWQKALI